MERRERSRWRRVTSEARLNPVLMSKFVRFVPGFLKAYSIARRTSSLCPPAHEPEVTVHRVLHIVEVRRVRVVGVLVVVFVLIPPQGVRLRVRVPRRVPTTLLVDVAVAVQRAGGMVGI